MGKLMALTTLAIIVAVVVFLFIVSMARKQHKEPKVGKALLVSLLVFLLVLVASTAADAFVQVQYGTVAVVTQFGKVVGVFEPGLHMKIPFVQDVVVYRTQEIVYETSSHPEESKADYRDYEVDTATSDGQQITARYTVRFRIIPERAMDIARLLGPEDRVVEKVVKASSRVHVRNILKRYEASQLYSGNVEEAQEEIASRLRKDFEKNGLELTFFGLRSIQFTEEYKQAVEQKQIAAENVTTKKHEAEQAKYEKERTITQAQAQAERAKLEKIGLAEGEAEAIRVKAKAEADAIKIKAQAQADANRLIAQSLSPEILRWQSILGWNGQFPMVVGGSGQFILPGDIFAIPTPTPTPTPTPAPKASGGR